MAVVIWIQTRRHETIFRMQLELFKQNANLKSVTVGHLLAMKSGIKDYNDDSLVSSACLPAGCH